MNTHEILYMNQYATSVYGREWQGRTCYSLFLDGQDVPCEACTNPLLAKDGVPQPAITTESRNVRNGRWYQCTDRAIEWTDGKLVRLQIAVDITDIKEMEQVKDEMISAVSHEMRTPLTAMLGFTEFLLETEVGADKQRGILEIIHKETERLNELIGTFLDMQRVRSEAFQLSPEALSVEDVLTEGARLYAINKEMHRIVVECPPGLPAIMGDSEKLHQVMINLISNACKYSPPGSEVKVGAKAGEGEVIISVQDEGIGVPQEFRQKIFEKFYRVDNSDRRMVGGTGLGLTLVKDIVTAHGGQIWIESNVPSGSRFLFTIPVART